MIKQTQTEKLVPPVQWFEKKTEDFSFRWENTPWHEGGERRLSPLKQSLRKYASSINELPENFLASVFDQHLAVLSEGYEYQILEILEVLGENRFLCRNTENQDFCVWSKSIAANHQEGNPTIFAVLIRLEDELEEESEYHPVNAITYGPVLGWKSLLSADFSFLARELRRDMFKLKGVSAVIAQDPVPFWALWTVSLIPPVIHGTEEVCTYWTEGRFSEDPGSFLTSGWKKNTIGKRVRYRKTGSKPFFEQIVIYDTKTMKGIILARRGSYYTKLCSALTDVFDPDPGKDGSINILCEYAMSDVLHITPSYRSWTTAFDKMDEQKAEEKSSPESKEMLDTMNAAMQDLIPFINSKTTPDWTKLVKKHGLHEDDIEPLKSIYANLQNKLR